MFDELAALHKGERDKRRSVYLMVKAELSVTCRLHVGCMSGTLLGEQYLFCCAEEKHSLMGGSFQYDSRAPSRVTSISFTPVGGTPFQYLNYWCC